MGFWGTLAIVRSDLSALELDAVRAWSRFPDGRRMADGWQLVGFRHDGRNGWESLLPALMEETGHPAIGAFVLDGDGAHVVGVGPRTGRWSTWLEIEGVLSHLVVPPVRVDENDVTTVDEDDPDYLRERSEMRVWLDALGSSAARAAPRAVAWAREAGLDPDPATVEAAMSRRGGFAEEIFFALLKTLGVPWPG